MNYTRPKNTWCANERVGACLGKKNSIDYYTTPKTLGIPEGTPVAPGHVPLRASLGV